MLKAFIDTSAILRLLVKDDDIKSRACERLIKEAKQKGLSYLILIICVYLIRDLLLYVVLPLSACNAIFK